MGLTKQSTGGGVGKGLLPSAGGLGDRTVALAGNPNTGKSTVFNSLTGMNQHTGNWPGKTVTNARGRYRHRGEEYLLVDLPGTYSLLANSVEEEVARDFICFGRPAVTVIVADATCLERNLNLVLQILEITDRVVVCVNLLDEAGRKNIRLDLAGLEKELGAPVVGTSARKGEGLEELKNAIAAVAGGKKTRARQILYPPEIEELVAQYSPSFAVGELSPRWLALRFLAGETKVFESIQRHLGLAVALPAVADSYPDFAERIVTSIVEAGAEIYRKVVKNGVDRRRDCDRKIDRVLTSKTLGFPIMLALLGIVFWLTIEGANYPSQWLASLFFGFEDWLSGLGFWSLLPAWVPGILIGGMYRTLAWVVSVMLPPMAIFFPLFTLLEDLGYLPRVAFNLDHSFKKACAHGKQALTMCMGFGCNAAGVIACRIIDSPRERLIATITNNFVPCNGRFPILIVMATAFLASGLPWQRGVAVASVLGAVSLGVIMTLVASRLLSKTLLRGLPSSFTLELPPYRKPQVGRIIVRSVFDRTLFVLGRAMAVAAPAGVLIWLLANTGLGGESLLAQGAKVLQPLGRLMGLDGIILMGFILGFPANEIVLPIIIMSYMASGSLQDFSSLGALRQLFQANGWTWLTAVNTMLFTLFHFPCGTTLWTIYRETRSRKWTLVSFLLPTAAGVAICMIVTGIARLLGLAA